MIRFTYKSEDPGPIDRPERFSMKMSEEQGLGELLQRFREFTSVLGYAESTWNQVIRELAANIEDGGAP